jgi:HK97 family phage prohead protease
MSIPRTVPTVGQRLIRAAHFEREAGGARSRERRFIASDETVDRYGDIVRATGWQLENFKRNPVLLFGHQSDQFPIGKVTEIGVEGTELIATAQFLPEGDDERADKAWRMVEGGFMSAVSVGFMPTVAPKFIRAEPDEDGYAQITGFEFVGQELLELSLVPVPANPQALALAKSFGITPERHAWMFGVDERAAARVAAQHRRNRLTIARLGPR